MRLPRLRLTRKIGIALALCLSLAEMLFWTDFVFAYRNSGYGAGAKPAWGLDLASEEQKDEIAALATDVGIQIDRRDGVAVLADLRAQGIDAVPAVGLGGIVAGKLLPRSTESATSEELMPLGGISKVRTVQCNESGQYVTYESDEHGFRNPKGIWDSPRADIAAVGESFVGGFCVPVGRGFVDLLRAKYPVTLNLGTSGQSALLQLAAIKEYLPPYAPRIVLWIFCEGIDLDDLQDEAKQPLLMRYLEPSFNQHLLGRQSDVDHALRQYATGEEARQRQLMHRHFSTGPFTDGWRGTVRLWHLREELNLGYGIGTGRIQSNTPSKTMLTLFTESVAQAKTVTRSYGGELYFVYLPASIRFRDGPRAANRERAQVIGAVKALGVPVMDIVPAFEANEDPLSLFPYRRCGHYNERGNAVVADAILRFLSAAQYSR